MRMQTLGMNLPVLLAVGLASMAQAGEGATIGRLYIVRKQDEVPFPVPAEINGKRTDAVVPGTCVYYDLPLGKYAIHAMNEIKDDVSVELAAGDAKFILLEGTDRKIGAGYLSQVTPKLVRNVDHKDDCRPGATSPL